MPSKNLAVFAYLTAVGGWLFPPADIIERDIAILGGGASGTYAAVALADLNQSVVVIERNDYLGGHTNTYIQSTTGVAVNYGVQIYHNDSTTREFHECLGVPLVSPTSSSGSDMYVDFAESQVIENFSVPPIGADYIDEFRKYPYLNDGFHLPDPVPEDLLLPWSDYVWKHNLTGSATAIFQAPGPAGRQLERLSVYVFNFVNSVVLSEMSGNVVHSASGDNSELYSKALLAIGKDNVILNTSVIYGQRKSSGIELVVGEAGSPASRKKRLIRAKKLIVAAPPRADNLASLGLDAREKTTLSQVGGYPFYAGVVSVPDLPRNFTYHNVASSGPFGVREPPCTVFIAPTSAVPGHFYYTYSSLEPLTRVQVEAAVADDIRNIQRALVREKGRHGPNARGDFIAWADHSPFHLEQSAESIRNGFYRDMYNLQGYRSTWYIGALFVLSSSQLWNNTAALLPDIMAATATTRS